MELSTLKQFVSEVALPGALEALQDSGQLFPISFLLYDDGQFGVAVAGGFSNEQDKRHYSRQVERVARQPVEGKKATGLVYLMEAWYSDVKPEEYAAWRQQYPSVSDDPQRKEAIFLWLSTAGKEWAMLRQTISRDDAGKPVLGEVADMDSPDLAGFWLSDTVPNPWRIASTVDRPGVLA